MVNNDYSKMTNVQVVNRSDVRMIKLEVVDHNAVKGRIAFYHPDCVFWLVGRDNDLVGYNVMLFCQSMNMPVSALRRVTK